MTIITPLLAGHDDLVRAVLDALPDGASSPLSDLPETHFARWVVMPDSTLLFSATHDAGDLDYLAEIRARLPDTADAVWRHCEGYPGMGEQFVGYLARHRVRTDLFVAAYPDATLADVREALELRRRLGDFVTRGQSMQPGELRDALREQGLA